jgi:L-alanine-DL-glutamate epimerase-like enolase superfamily enzyme
MQRRTFLAGGLAMAGLAAAAPAAAQRAKMTIRRIRYYEPLRPNPTFNQSDRIVLVETDAGITGIGEGGSKDMLEQCAAMLIGENPSRIDHLWQLLYRGFFYPPGREKLHALGALDLALWDIKGKALGVPVYELLGGLSRDYIECYSTGYPSKGNVPDTARACLQAGFRSFRTSLVGAVKGLFNARQVVQKTFEHCREIREGIGPEGDWAIDFHTCLDLPDAVRLAALLEPLNPLFVEDPLRSENTGVLRNFRLHSRVPVAVGEQFGARWDFNELIEQRTIDYLRATLPNVGGITEFMKIAALCETHYVGLIPHFTGPIALAALTHVLGVFSGPVLMEVLGQGPGPWPHLSQGPDFHIGKLWPRDAPGLGIQFNPEGARLIAEISEPSRRIRVNHRPDGSITNW